MTILYILQQDLFNLFNVHTFYDFSFFVKHMIQETSYSYKIFFSFQIKLGIWLNKAMLHLKFERHK